MIYKSILNIVTSEAKFFLVDLESQGIYSKRPDYLTLMSKFEYEEVEIRRLTRPNYPAYFRICCEQGHVQKKTVYLCSFYAGFQKMVVTPFNRDLGLQLICQAEITFEGIINDHYFHPVKRLENGQRVYKKEQILEVDIQKVNETLLINFYGRETPDQSLATVCTFVVFFNSKSSKVF